MDRLIYWLKSRPPAHLIVGSFGVTILLGTLLLMLPAASRETPLSALDALFTATSALCVTGLIVVDTGSYFTPFGQMVILALIQVGGLGIMSFSTLFLYMMKKPIPLSHQDIISGTLGGQNPVRVVRGVVKLTLLVETAGALLLTLGFARTSSLPKALYLGFFHAISAFCNAGFALFADSFIGYQSDWLINVTLIALIITGGIGFWVLLDVGQWVKNPGHLKKLSLHTKVTLVTSGLLILTGTVYIALLEMGNGLRGMPWSNRFLCALFQAVTPRTAGFNTLDIGLLSNATLLGLTLFMVIGGGAGSCAGGIKVNTFAILWGAARAWLHNRTDVSLFWRRIPENTVAKAISVMVVSTMLIAGVTLILLITELGGISHQTSQGKSMELFFEAVSAFGTVGLSTGITPTLTAAGRLLITALMFTGRVGPLTLALVIQSREPQRFRYPEEDIMVG